MNWAYVMEPILGIKKLSFRKIETSLWSPSWEEVETD